MDVKQGVVLRGDLTLSTGKWIAQACHASLQAFIAADDDTQDTWMQHGAKKVVVNAENQEHIGQLAEKAGDMGLPHAVIRDAGKTEVEQGTVTALGVGPGEAIDVDKVTGSLPLVR